jgi:hypothetical protein
MKPDLELTEEQRGYEFEALKIMNDPESALAKLLYWALNRNLPSDRKQACTDAIAQAYAIGRSMNS